MKKKMFIWNMFGSLCNAFSSMLLLIVVNRATTPYNGGIFSLGFATAQMMTTLGTLEVRNYQATDVKEEFSFNDYYSFRISTCAFMLFCSICYVFANGYTAEKMIITILLCLYKMVEAFSDVFEGLYQQKNRIDLSGKAAVYRIVIATSIFVVVIVLTKNLVLSTLIMFISALTVAAVYNKYTTEKNWFKFKMTFEPSKWKGLGIQCIPLAIGAFLALYVGNAPKYAVDAYLGPETQNVFSIIFMPAFVINLFSLFVFRPMLTSMAISWNEKKIYSFLKILGKALVWALVVLALGLGAAYLLGIPILSVIYGIDLTPYKLHLMLIMLGGGANAIVTILRFTLTVVRKQLMSMWGYVIAFVVTIIFCPMLVKKYSLMGACYSYIVSMTIMGLVFLIILATTIMRVRKD
ncbi:O-antigen/teichoic acid export membrane protein [Muricomes intestini]|jgi:O-antigen/teichoic acid export membrane protein|uniref:O-antigen/teichoic acid export membrane protein n=1 Tax=Muricomes intestini TaxID=1796634 RepID=A0A4R3KBY4_9FIRM|nr:lipopolysaccharide biosynthesis protein [Muricomes intestini]TCS80706.1 O-antigen/teichoic acid export membrane protein [Muricomes intestini]